MTHTTDFPALVRSGEHVRGRNAYERVSFDAREFDCVDTKGRAFGGYASVEIETRTADETSCYLTKWIGSRYRVATGARRGGKSFGGSQTITYCDSKEEVEATIAKYFANAEKRAMKNKARAA
jgi:hypothetical protein